MPDLEDLFAEHQAWVNVGPPLSETFPEVAKKNSSPMTGRKTVSEVFCVGHPSVAPIFHKIVKAGGFTPIETVDPKGIVGIEVEVENVTRITPEINLGFWRIDNDGSLRNNGKEFISAPIPTAYVVPALENLFRSLNKDLDFSRRTSIHVHFNVTQMTLDQLTGFLYVYLSVEKLLFDYAGLKRATSVFCVPLTETVLAQSLVRHPRDSAEIFYRKLQGFWQKYTALNLLPMYEQGSIEFRHMPGTASISRIVTWINLLSCLKLFVYRYSLEQVIHKISQLNTSSGYSEFLEDVFGKYLKNFNPMGTYQNTGIDLTGIARKMEQGVFMVKNSSTLNQYHGSLNQTAILPKSGMMQYLISIEPLLYKEILTPEQYLELSRLALALGHGGLGSFLAESLLNAIVSEPSKYWKIVTASFDEGTTTYKVLKDMFATMANYPKKNVSATVKRAIIKDVT